MHFSHVLPPTQYFRSLKINSFFLYLFELRVRFSYILKVFERKDFVSKINQRVLFDYFNSNEILSHDLKNTKNIISFNLWNVNFNVTECISTVTVTVSLRHQYGAFTCTILIKTDVMTTKLITSLIHFSIRSIAPWYDEKESALLSLFFKPTNNLRQVLMSWDLSHKGYV